MPPRPRSAERATLAGHATRAEEDAYLADIKKAFPCWHIYRADNGDLVAEHRTEKRDERRERAGIHVRVTAPVPDVLHRCLFVQEALRGDGDRAA